MSAWDVHTENTKQDSLIISFRSGPLKDSHGEHVITVDNIKVAQFINLLLHNQEIRDVIDTINISKGTLEAGASCTTISLTPRHFERIDDA